MFSSDSILLRILFLIDVIPWSKPNRKRGRPFYYSPTVMVRCFIVRVWIRIPMVTIVRVCIRIPGNNALFFLIDMPYNRKVMKACGLDRLPDRRTFDRRSRPYQLT